MNDYQKYSRAFAEKSVSPFRRYRIIAFEGIDGSGKTTASAAVEQALSAYFKILRTRLSLHMGNVFRDMVDRPSEERIRYQDVIPGSFRSFTYVVDAVVQFRYLADLYDSHDILIFDRWLPTYHVYCAEPGGKDASSGLFGAADQQGSEWRRKLVDAIPVPDLIFYLKADPRAAALRLKERGDWTARNWSDTELLADLTRLDARYLQAMRIWPGHIVDANAPLPQVVDAVLERICDLMAASKVAEGEPA